jgi:glycerol-3-phosphate acyltransferase PlsY
MGDGISPTLRPVDSVIAVVLAYVIGSIDFGVIVPRAFGVDIYTAGSGNPGTSNVFRTMGKKAAGLVLLGDAMKGLAAAGIADVWIGGPTAFAAGFAAVAGHIFPVWHRFKGGKGVATAIGAALWLEPLVGLTLAVGWLVVVIVTKTASLASLGAMVLYVPGFAIGGERDEGLWWAAATAVLVVVRHRGNIERLLSGGERSVEGL